MLTTNSIILVSWGFEFSLRTDTKSAVSRQSSVVVVVSTGTLLPCTFCRFHRALDGNFTGFTEQFDVAYCPMQGLHLDTGFADDTWRIESGVMVFTANTRSRALTRAALELYEGGILAISEVRKTKNNLKKQIKKKW